MTKQVTDDCTLWRRIDLIESLSRCAQVVGEPSYGSASTASNRSTQCSLWRTRRCSLGTTTVCVAKHSTMLRLIVQCYSMLDGGVERYDQAVAKRDTRSNST
jgi:hypothetical protein